MSYNPTLYLEWCEDILNKAALSDINYAFKKHNLNVIFAKISALNTKAAMQSQYLTLEQLSLLAQAEKYGVKLPDLSDINQIDWDGLNDEILDLLALNKDLLQQAHYYGIPLDQYTIAELSDVIEIHEEEHHVTYADNVRWHRAIMDATKL